MSEITLPAWSNMVQALPTNSAFIADLARAVSNSGEPEAGAVWLLTFVSDFLQSQKQPFGPIAAFDFAVYDIEAVSRAWGVFRIAADAYRADGVQVADDVLTALARFLVERMPAIWRGDSWILNEHPEHDGVRQSWLDTPVTLAVGMADHADTLVGMFAAGLNPNGSKDPFALRRAAASFLRCVMLPITRHERIAA